MNQYLYSIRAELSHISDKSYLFLIDELDNYIKYWNQYSNVASLCSNHPIMPQYYDKHNFNFHTHESISISWEIESLHKYAETNLSLKYLSLNEFEKITGDDILNSNDEFSSIYKKVTSIKKHMYSTILIMNFHPMDAFLILDGRHKYIEYKKFKKDSRLPIYLLNDLECISAIFYKRERLAYVILHNIKIIYEYINNIGSINNLLRITDDIL